MALAIVIVTMLSVSILVVGVPVYTAASVWVRHRQRRAPQHNGTDAHRASVGSAHRYSAAHH